MKTIVYDNMLFICDNESDINSLFTPTETFDVNFRYISGSRKINSNYLTVVENLLDNLHISFVHSFGSKISLPKKIKYTEIDKNHGKTTFLYEPNVNSISHLLTDSKSNNLIKNTTVMVENEFILPSSTITRVFFGKDNIKTVFTRCSPISDGECRLYWRLYRNYWVGNQVVDPIGDLLMAFLMEQTLDEDVRILQNVNDAYRVGKLQTKYDRTIVEFRNSINRKFNE